MGKILVRTMAPLAVLAMACFVCPTSTLADGPPLPSNVNIVAPKSDVPKGLAVFSGRWEGFISWTRSGNSNHPQQWRQNCILIVESIAADGTATAIVAWDKPISGTDKEMSMEPGFTRATVKLAPGSWPIGHATITLVSPTQLAVGKEIDHRPATGTLNKVH